MCATATLALITLQALPATLAWGRSFSEAIPNEYLAPETIQASLRQMEDAPDLDEPTRAKARELYAKAQGELELAKTWRAKVERFSQMVVLAPQELEQTKADLAAVVEAPDLAVPSASLAELEALLSAKESELTEQRAAVTELESELRRRASRRIEIPKLVAAAQEQLGEVLRQLHAPVVTEPPAITAARRIKLLARREALEQELASYEREQRAYEVRTELLSSQRDLAARRAAHLEQVVLEWRTQVTRQRYRETETQLQQARREAAQAHPALEQLAENNARWAERRKELAELIATTTRDLDQTNDRLTTLQDQFERTREKVDTVGLTNAIGLLLRNQRESLPSDHDYLQRIGARQPTIRDCQFELLQLKDRRSELANLDVQVQRELDAMARDFGPDDLAELKISVEGILQSELDYLDALILDTNSYFDRLVDLDNAERQLAAQTHDYSTYINERVLWIQSATVLDAQDAR
ncbi:MAG: hypothetical protein U1E05_24145, partial [Patescibacteria group bacterium]|nr:hypothetical protein [Patescibacteria group bacterium]